ncbi:MAG: glycosyl transferase family 1, partial [Pedobacter sp.]
MKLLRIIPSINPKVGGPPEGIRNITPHLLRNGIYTTILTSDDLNSDFGDKDLDIINLGGRISMWGYAPKLSQWLQLNLGKYDVVICHGLWLYHSFATRLAIMRLRKKGISVPKLFLMPHGMLDPYFQKSETRRIKSIRNFIYWLFIERINVEKSDGVLFTCDEEMRLARTTFPLYKPKATYN